SEAGEVSGRRLKSYQEIIEQEERERKEREEQRVREEVRGEWAITVGSGAQSYKGVALITHSANSKDEFAASSAIYEGVNPAPSRASWKAARPRWKSPHRPMPRQISRARPSPAKR